MEKIYLDSIKCSGGREGKGKLSDQVDIENNCLLQSTIYSIFPFEQNKLIQLFLSEEKTKKTHVHTQNRQ